MLSKFVGRYFKNPLVPRDTYRHEWFHISERVDDNARFKFAEKKRRWKNLKGRGNPRGNKIVNNSACLLDTRTHTHTLISELYVKEPITICDNDILLAGTYDIRAIKTARGHPLCNAGWRVEKTWKPHIVAPAGTPIAAGRGVVPSFRRRSFRPRVRSPRASNSVFN